MPSKKVVAVKTLDELLQAMLVLSRAIDHVIETRAVEQASEIALSASKVQILRLLGRGASRSSSQIARFLGVSKPAVTQIVDSLVRAKLVTRKTAKNDRRELSIRLSEKGKKLAQAIQREQRQFVRSSLAQAGNVDAKRWVTMAQRMATSLAQSDDSFKHFCYQCGAEDDGTCVLTGGDAECLFLRRRSRARDYDHGTTRKR